MECPKHSEAAKRHSEMNTRVDLELLGFLGGSEILEEDVDDSNVLLPGIVEVL